MQIALLVKPQLILIDAQLLGDGATIMEKRLARWCAGADIYTFADRDRPRATTNRNHQLNWDQLPMLLRAWSQLHSQAFGVRTTSFGNGGQRPATTRETPLTQAAA
jgi:hypothetical protein